mmetsp:Transcript_16147/g.50511  ORF Transcript_16147/g.50511 Transcript_16147/m.50511 type:complete len:463 (-) Transcript_16147:23-1411(-)
MSDVYMDEETLRQALSNPVGVIEYSVLAPTTEVGYSKVTAASGDDQVKHDRQGTDNGGPHSMTYVALCPELSLYTPTPTSSALADSSVPRSTVGVVSSSSGSPVGGTVKRSGRQLPPRPSSGRIPTRPLPARRSTDPPALSSSSSQPSLSTTAQPSQTTAPSAASSSSLSYVALNPEDALYSPTVGTTATAPATAPARTSSSALNPDRRPQAAEVPRTNLMYGTLRPEAALYSPDLAKQPDAIYSSADETLRRGARRAGPAASPTLRPTRPSQRPVSAGAASATLGRPTLRVATNPTLSRPKTKAPTPGGQAQAPPPATAGQPSAPVGKTVSLSDAEKLSYYHPSATRASSAVTLASSTTGAFLLRPSSVPSAIALSVKRGDGSIGQHVVSLEDSADGDDGSGGGASGRSMREADPPDEARQAGKRWVIVIGERSVSSLTLQGVLQQLAPYVQGNRAVVYQP